MTLRFYAVFALFAALLLFAAGAAQAQQVQWATKYDTSPALRNVDPSDVPSDDDGPYPVKVAPVPSEEIGSDPVLQSSAGTADEDGPLQNFDGLGVQENLDVTPRTIGFAPPDPNVAVGENYVVQMVNLIFAVYNKDGSQAMSPLPGNAVWDGFGGPCEFNNDGDPIVLYDEEAERWVLSQFAIAQPNFRECVAVSKTSDPTGEYYRYAFEMPEFNDFPKLGVGLNSYTYTYVEFTSEREGPVVGAFERDAMLNGQNARKVLFGPATDFSNVTFLPADIDGSRPASGTPNFYAGLDVNNDRIILCKTEVDWSNPDNAIFEEVATLDVQNFDADLCDGGVPGREDCIPQPNGVKLDALSDRLNHRLQLRDRGGHLAMVANHTVDVNDADQAGVRWYELRRPDGGSWSIHQQGTYAPSDGLSRWMGSIAMNQNGRIGLIYTVSSENKDPSIRYTGRRPSDPLGQMTAEETSVVSGSRSQEGGVGSSQVRWGDYASLVIDPTDGATFWGTHQYGRDGEPDPGWDTRIFSFKVPIKATLSGPSTVNSGQEGTWTADVEGGEGSTSYDWSVREPGATSWTGICSGQTCSYTFTNFSTYVQDVEIRVTVDKGSETDTDSQWVTVSPGAPGCEPWMIECPSTQLANLRSFEAEPQDEKAQLAWTTTGSMGEGAFLVQHRADSTAAWSNLQTVEVAEMTQVDSTDAPTYQLETDALAPGTHQFRLQWAAGSETALLSDVVEAEITLSDPYRLRAYPNPAGAQMTVESAVKERQHVRVQIYDVLGRRVTTVYDGPMTPNEVKRFTVQPGTEGLSSGTYFLRMTGEQFQTTTRISVVR